MPVEVRRSIDLPDAISGLQEIFDELQANPATHDAWDWINAYFYLEVIKALAPAQPHHKEREEQGE